MMGLDRRVDRARTFRRDSRRFFGLVTALSGRMLVVFGVVGAFVGGIDFFGTCFAV